MYREVDASHIAALIAITGDDARVLTQPLVVEQLSRDFYWYSPVLRKQLDGKVAGVIVQPLGAVEIQAILRYCYAQNIPVTLRGAGTGNYGQAVPLYGGVVLDLTRMDQIEEIQPEGVAVCQPGVRLGVLENEARKAGWELRCYPSTVVKSSLGGFLGGGSGGIGSVKNGNLRDFETVRALEVVTMEPEPRVILHEGEAVHDILHAWGTNGVITRIWLALAAAIDWAQVRRGLRHVRRRLRFQRKHRHQRRMDQAPGHRFRVAHPLLFHACKTVRAQSQGPDLLPDRRRRDPRV